MAAEKDYLAVNRDSWNKRTDVHYASDFYDVEGFLKGKSSLNSIELDLLGDVKGRSILHLQCHFGQDSISLSRMGAEVTGVDLSDKAIERAKELAAKAGTNTRFICCDLYDLPDHLDEQFDIVFTSYGTIGWLPDLDKWADVVSRFMKPGGRFVFAEFHPVVWMYDNDFEGVQYSYFNTGRIVESDEGTYADREADIKEDNITWNHGIAEVLTSLLGKGLTIDAFREFDYSPYACFRKVEEFEPGRYRIPPFENKIPLVYALAATKK